MMMKVNIASCQKGDIIASDVYDVNDLLIVTKNTVLNEYIINQLMNRGVYHVNIYSADNRDYDFYGFRTDYYNAVTAVKSLIMELQTGHALDYAKLYELSNIILKGFRSSNEILMYLDNLKAFDDYTYTHSIDTAFYGMLLGKWLGLSDSHMNNLIITGLLHDIGKLGISDVIINKPGRLSEEEFNEMKKHSIIGYNMLIDVKELDSSILFGVLHHHERFDGSGYPHKLKNDDIHMYGRIIAIADVYDALTTDRVYRKRVTPFEAFELFMTTGRSQFDPAFINCFLYNIASYLPGAKVVLTDGNEGEIVYIPPHNIINPIIKVSSEYLELSEVFPHRVQSFIGTK